MKKLLLDTNIILDILAKGDLFYFAAAKLFSIADKKKLKMCVSVLNFAN